MNQEQTNHILYTPELIAFAQSGVRFASLLEQCKDKHQLIAELVQVLPRLYSLTLALPEYAYDIEFDLIEEYITEQQYEHIRTQVETLLGNDDVYLGNSPESMTYPDELTTLHLSEQLADIYQQVGNLLGVLKAENTVALPSAIGKCLYYWQEYWGATLLSSLGAIHQLYLPLRGLSEGEGTSDFDEQEYPDNDY